MEYEANDSLQEVYIFETTQCLEQLEQAVLRSEESNGFSQDDIDEVFRMMHNIKSASAMMLFTNISELAHCVEDLFFFLREHKQVNVNNSLLSDLILESADFIKVELEKVKNGDVADGDISILSEKIKKFLTEIQQGNDVVIACEEDKQKIAFPISQDNLQKAIKLDPHREVQNDGRKNTEGSQVAGLNYYKAVVYFPEGCEMENIRAYSIIHQFKEFTQEIYYFPGNLLEGESSITFIKEQGFKIYMKTNCTYNEIVDFFNQSVFFKDLELKQLPNDDEFKQFSETKVPAEQANNQLRQIPEENRIKGKNGKDNPQTAQQSIISVNVVKLDKLMDLVGEIVIAEAMVTQNPDLRGLELENFKKASTQLHKIITEVQDTVMSIRMVSLSATFQKMKRIVRDMSKKLMKDVELEIIGEETEVDKNIIEHISDPLMHLVRNAVDHGLETPEERQEKGKTSKAKVVLEARNAGNDVLVMVKDNGKGLDKEKILKHAKEKGLLIKPAEEMTDREIYSLIFTSGFSTKANITEFSGRGVGMDVVSTNIEAIGGTVLVDSVLEKGTTITLKIPLTLAIIDGMNISVGKACYTVPIHSIKEVFRPQERDLLADPDGKEMIMVRGQCYPILRLHEVYNVQTEITSLFEGIFVMVEDNEKTQCVFADKLLGEQQVVVKALPNFIRRSTKQRGLAGCTLLGDGSISLILDVAGLFAL